MAGPRVQAGFKEASEVTGPAAETADWYQVTESVPAGHVCDFTHWCHLHVVIGLGSTHLCRGGWAVLCAATASDYVKGAGKQATSRPDCGDTHARHMVRLQFSGA